MDEERYQSHLATLVYQPQNNTFIESYQYKDDRGFQTQEVILKKDDPNGLKDRLQAPVPSPDEINGGSRILLLEVPTEAEDDLGTAMVPWSREEFDTIMHTMCLPKEYTELITFRASQFTYLPPVHPETCLSYVYITSHRVAPVIRITASYDSKTKITSVLAQQEHSEHFPFKTFTAWLSSASAIAHPLALLFPILGEYNAIMLRHASDAISDTGALELEIGQHNYQSKLLDQMIDLSVMDFPNVVRRLNGSSSSLACFELGCEEMIECLAQVSKLLDINHTNTPDMSSNIAQLQEFRSRIQYWNTSQKSLLLRVRFCQKIAQTQLAVVYNFIAQRDSQLNLRIAETSSALAATSAKDSATMKAIAIAAKEDSATMKTIAIAAKRDSSAMKTIAVLTMVFLPGTFVAAFLSMPLFDWTSSTSSHIATTPSFWIFWAITIPLTLLVLTIWAAWMKIVVPRQQLQDEEILESWKEDVEKDEVKQD